MSGEIFTKAAFARRVGVKPSAVSNYIARGKLTAPALRADGTIDAALADQQLDIRLETVRRVGQLAKSTAADKVVGSSDRFSRSSAEVVDLSASRQLLQVRSRPASFPR